MPGIRIGEMWFDSVDDAMVEADCGHTVLCNAAEEVWENGKVKTICDACFYPES